MERGKERIGQAPILRLIPQVHLLLLSSPSALANVVPLYLEIVLVELILIGDLMSSYTEMVIAVLAFEELSVIKFYLFI